MFSLLFVHIFLTMELYFKSHFENNFNSKMKCEQQQGRGLETVRANRVGTVEVVFLVKVRTDRVGGGGEGY